MTKKAKGGRQVKCLDVPIGAVRELTWFCNNVRGVRTDFNLFLDQVNKFESRIERLEKTCADIDRFMKLVEQSSKRGRW